MRFLSRAQRWIAWAVCGLAVLVALFVLALPWSTRYLVDRVAVLLSERYDIDFSAGRVEFALRSLSFTLHDVRLATGAVPESATVVAKRVNLDLATAALRGALAFDRIEIVDPSVSWIAGGRMPASRVPRATRTDPRPVINVARLDVVNLDATMSTASSLRLTVQGLSASLRSDVQGRLVGEIHADRGIRLEAESVAGMLDRVTANVTIGSETLAIRSLVAESSSGDIRLDGALMFGESGGYDLKYRSTIDVSELRTWWDRSPPARGRVELSGSIAGVLNDPRLTFDVRAPEFSVGALLDGRLDATGHASLDSIVIETCVLRSVEGIFNGRGRIALRDGGGRSLLTGDWSLPRLRTLASRLNLDPSRLPALPVSGTANLSWPGPRPAIGTLAGDLHVNLRKPGEGSLTVSGQAGRWRLQYRHALAGGTLAELRLTTVLQGAELRRSRLNGVVDVSSQDIAALLWQLRESAIPVSAVVDVVRSGQVTARGTVAGSIGEPVVALLVSASDVSAGDVDAIQVTGEVHADRRQMVLKSLAADTAAAHLEMRGSIGFARLESTGEFDVRVDGPGGLASIVPADWRPTGSIAAKGSWSGRLDRPRVSARLTAEELIANGLHFERLAGDIEVVDDELLVRDLLLFQRNGQLRVDGSYNIRERALSTTVEGRGLHVTLRRLWSPPSDDPSVADAELESVSVDMRLEGSVQRPLGEVSLTADSVRLSGRDAGAMVARAHTAQGQIRVDLGAPRFGAEASGSVTLQSPRRWTADVSLNNADVVQALTLLGVDSETVAGSTVALSASGQASGNLDTRLLSNATMEIRALGGQVRGQPLSLVQPARLSLEGSRLALEPVQIGLGGLSVRAAGSWGSTRDSPAEGIAVNLDGRVEDLLEYLPPASRDRLSAEGPLGVKVSIRGGADLAAISGDAFAQLTYREEKAPERAGSRPARARTLTGEVRLALDLRATAFDLNAVDGTIVATTLDISAGQFPIAQQAPTRLRLEKGRIHIEQFDLKSSSGALAASGTIGLGPANHSDMRVSGATSLGLVDAFLPAGGAGSAAFDIRIAGPIDSPQYQGTIELTDASLILPEGRVSLAGWTGRLEVAGETIAASALRGQVNGGDVSVNGTVTRRGIAQASPLTITARNVFLEIPRGLRSELNADLIWRNQSGRAALSGTATITADPYREPATALVRIVSALTRVSSDKRRALPQWLGDTTLDVTLQSDGPLTLENSVGNVDMVPDLRLTGTMSDAGLAGSIAIVDDGRIQVRGRAYRLRESAIVFTPEQGLVPRLNVFGETRIGDYEVTVRLSGPADAIETSLSSNPPLSDRDLQSLVVTGQTAGLTGETANNDAFAVGAVSGDVLGFAGQFVGLDSVRVGSSDDLELVSSDVEPSTRLTVSKRLGQLFELVLSENLDDSELTWVIIYRPRPGYQVRLSSRAGEQRTIEFRQEITFGPGSSLRPAVVRVEKLPDVVSGITVSGDPGLSPSDVRDALELREGDRFDFREWSRDRDRVQRLYYDRGYYAVHVTPTRKVGDATSKRREVTLDYRILRGPRTELEVIGYPSSAKLAESLKSAWNDALLPELLAQDLESATRAHLSEEGYLRPHVDVTLDNSRPGVQRALVQVTPGARITIRQLTFEGNQAISTSALQTLASERALAASVWNDPTPLVEEIVAEYASRGYLAATAAVGDLLLDGNRATLPVLVSEGPLARVETLQIAGVSAVRQQGAEAALGLAIGSPFAEGAERGARVRLERYYRDRGYREARVEATTRVTERDGRVDLSFTVTEGPLYVVRGIRVEGAQSTSDSMVDRAVTITSGEAAGQSEAAETERRLYGLGTFRAAAVRFEPVPSLSSEETVAVDAVVEVQEARRYLLRYGIALSQEYEAVLGEDVGSVGVAADLRDRNFLGRGIALGLGARVEPDMASVRGLFSMPRLASLPLRTNLSLTLRTKTQTSSDGTLYSDDEANLTLEQRWRPRGWLDLAWGYSASSRAVSFELPEPPTRPISLDGLLASLNATAVLDRRNSVFDPTRGWFYSTSLQWGLRAVGSDFDYLRTLIRGSYYHPIGPVVLASNARWGHLQPRGGTPPLTVFDVFFKAGGTQTVRGYKQDELSAYNAFDIPLGGTRLVVFNEEIRFPIFRIVKGVLFADAGNTFAEGAGVSISDLEVGVGFGLRITTPLAPVRIDVGYPVPGSGLTSPRWHFSIGQMF
jgi:outer membrane protein insertion porin family